jgi:hypothetical protein
MVRVLEEVVIEQVAAVIKELSAELLSAETHSGPELPYTSQLWRRSK